jgi:hypothetical protein
VNIALVENIQKSFDQRHKVMVTSSEYLHARDEFIRRTRGGVFSLFQDVNHCDMNESRKRLCAFNQQICGDMLYGGMLNIKTFRLSGRTQIFMC